MSLSARTASNNRYSSANILDFLEGESGTRRSHDFCPLVHCAREADVCTTGAMSPLRRVCSCSTSDSTLAIHFRVAFLRDAGRTRPSVPFHHLCATRTTRQHSDPRMCRRHRKSNNEKRLLHRRARTHTTNSFFESTTRHNPQEPTSQEQAASFFVSVTIVWARRSREAHDTASGSLARHTAKPLLQNTSAPPVWRHLRCISPPFGTTNCFFFFFCCISFNGSRTVPCDTQQRTQTRKNNTASENAADARKNNRDL